jgi:glyoxylase I family protein
MAQDAKQNELRNVGKSRIGSINHLRLTVTDIQRAERFYRPLMRFMEYELCDCEDNRLAWAKWSSSGVFG